MFSSRWRANGLRIHNRISSFSGRLPKNTRQSMRWNSTGDPPTSDPNVQSRPASINTSAFRQKILFEDERYPTSSWSTPTNNNLERPIPRPLSFDKERYIHLLVSEGLSQQQADGLVALIEEAVYDSINSVSRSLVTKPEHAETMNRSSEDIKSLQYEIQLLEKKDFVALKQDLERISLEVQRLKSTLVDDLSRVHGGVRLDINLEKARIKDEAQDLDNLINVSVERIQTEMSLLNDRIKLIRKSTRQFLAQLIGLLAVMVVVFKYTSSTHPPHHHDHHTSSDAVE